MSSKPWYVQGNFEEGLAILPYYAPLPLLSMSHPVRDFPLSILQVENPNDFRITSMDCLGGKTLRQPPMYNEQVEQTVLQYTGLLEAMYSFFRAMSGLQ